VIDNLGDADESDDQSGAAAAESFNEVIESGAGIGGNLLGLVCFVGIVVLLSIGNKSCQKFVETDLGWRFLWIFKQIYCSYLLLLKKLKHPCRSQPHYANY
jgi:hypothetical protein